MNLKLKTILRQLDQLSQVEPSKDAAEKAIANARARLKELSASSSPSQASSLKTPRQRSRTMFRRAIAVALTCATAIVLVIVFIWPAGQSQLAFAQVIGKVEKTQSLSLKTKLYGPDEKSDEEMRITVLPNGKMRGENSKCYSIQDLKSHKMIVVFKENKTAQIMDGFSPPERPVSERSLYEMLRNIRQDAVERLPDDTIDGRKVAVFRAEIKELPGFEAKQSWTKIWVDPQTELPVRVENSAQGEDGKTYKSTMYDLVFDQPIDPTLFEFAPPAGYTVERGGIANFPDLPDKTELRAPEIIPGVGLGPVRFGMSREKIESIFGKPDGYEANETSLLYYSRGFVLSVSHRGGLKNVTCDSQMLMMNRVRDFAGKTKEGIGIGSTLEAVEKTFGKPDRDQGFNAYNKSLVYEKYGLEIQFVADKVIRIIMSEAAPQEETSSQPAAKQPVPVRTLKVNVVNSDGKPVPKAKILAAIWSKEKNAKANQVYVTDPQGQTAIELPKTFDILRLFTRCDGYVPLFTHWERLDKNPPDTFTITLTKGTTIGGFVKNEKGQPIRDAKVEVMLSQSNMEQLKRTSFCPWLAEGDDAKTTDTEGRWTLDNVPQGEVKLLLKINHPDYVSDTDWGGLQKEQKISLENLWKLRATVVLQRKKQGQ